MTTLRRELGVFGATMMGLGSILGTGVFVSIGIAAGIAGPGVIVATMIAAGLAVCNALSSAQLAAVNPVSGGTYEYGYRYLHPSVGFVAGWMFLCAKTASAASAAIGFSGYLLNATGLERDDYSVGVALLVIVALTSVVMSGIRLSNWTNIVIVSITLASLGAFVLAGIPCVLDGGVQRLTPLLGTSLPSVFHASALMFVAFAGYGRIATLGEEVREPSRTIPRAIVATLVLSAILYIAVAVVGIGAAGAEAMHTATVGQAAPLEVISRQFALPAVHRVVAVGAMCAMLGVLLNLLLGLSRVLLAMGRRRDMPGFVTAIGRTTATPYTSVLMVGVVIAALVAAGNLKTTWSFSAFSILIYYAITNMAALRLPEQERLYSPCFARVGLAACLFLAFWVEWQIWASGIALLLVGLAWYAIALTFRATSSNEA